MSKHISWFSCGAPSAVMSRIASKLIPDIHIVYCRVVDEHEDNMRFLKDCEKWIGKEIEIIQSDKYSSVDDVIEKKKFMSGFAGAPCTMHLKRDVRLKYSDVNDIHYWGFTVEEKKRADEFSLRNPLLINRYPLIEYGITEEMCYGLIQEAGIELPVMYKLGFKHNNCIGCVKSGSPMYWNMIRKFFPEVFWKRAKQERILKYALCSKVIDGEKVRIFLDELDPMDFEETERQFTCDLGCQTISKTF